MVALPVRDVKVVTAALTRMAMFLPQHRQTMARYHYVMYQAMPSRSPL